MTAYAASGPGEFDLPGMFKQFLAETGLKGGRGQRGSWGAGFGGGDWLGAGWPGAAFGNGGPFGGRGGGQQRSNRAGRGDVRSAVLALLVEQPMHGYQIIQEISRRSGASWKPSPGSVYPTLQQLEDEGLVRAEEQDGRRVFRLTDDGAALAAERAEEFASLWDAFAPTQDDTQLGDLIFQVGAAFLHVARTGTPDQMAQARTVLARTRTDLYRILGDDTGSADRTADNSDSDENDEETGR